MTLIMMKSKELSLYLKGKIPPKQIRSCIYKSLKDEVVLREHIGGPMEGRICDVGYKLTVTALQFLNLLNDFINGKLNK